MNESEKRVILEAAKNFMRERIIPKHISNTRKLSSIDSFFINPFTQSYLTKFAFGDDSSYNMARVLVYARALGTSINTSFGQNMQYFINEVLSSFPSVTPGMDIEFTDELDHVHKYCQVKAGPNTINKDGGLDIKRYFENTLRLARTNGARIAPSDCVVGILYGTRDEINAFYRKLDEDYTVLVGQEFWHHLTGDPDFYNDLINAFREVSDEVDSAELLQETINSLAQEIENTRNE